MALEQDSAQLDSAGLRRAASLAGFEVSGRMVETFRNQGLIPRPTRAGHQGRAPLWIYPPGCDRQLISLLGWREHTKDPGLLRVLVWLDGFPIPLGEVRDSLVRNLQSVILMFEEHITKAQQTGLNPDKGGDRGQALHALAQVIAAKRGPKSLPRYSRMSAAERTHAIEVMLRLFALGEQVEGTAKEADTVERVLGVTPNGRRQHVFGAEPWLTGPPEELFGAAHVVALPKLLEDVSEATAAELETARQTVAALFQHLPLVIRMLSAITTDNNYAGMAALSDLDQHPDFVLLLLPAVIAMLRAGWNENLQGIISALAVLPEISAQIARLLEMPSNTIASNVSTQPREVQEFVQRIIQAAIDGQ